MEEEARRRTQGRGRIGRKIVFSFVLLGAAVVGGSGWVLVELAEYSLKRQMSKDLLAEVKLVATGLSLNGQVIRRLRPGYENFRVYKKWTARLRQAQAQVGARRNYVFDRKGRSLLDTEAGIRIGHEYPHLRIRDHAEMEKVWRGEAAHSVLFTDDDGTLVMTGYAPVYAGDEIIGAVGMDIGVGFVDTLHVFERSVLVFSGISVLLTVVVGLALARTITQPIQRLVRAAREIGRGNLAQAVDTPAQDEIGYLGETMEEMRRKILARDSQLRQMLAGVAHEIRNPLGGIEIYAGLIAEDLPGGDGRKEHIQKVIGEVRRLNQVISEFLDFARPAPPSPERTPLAALVEDAAFLLGPEMEEAGVEYRQEVASGVEVYADPEQVKRALFNLMKNGVQAMRRSGLLQVRGGAEGGGVLIEVEDSGPGIEAAVATHLFEPFFTTREKGSGLGLAIVQQNLEKNGGQIEWESRPGAGTIFRVFLPGFPTGESAPVAGAGARGNGRT